MQATEILNEKLKREYQVCVPASLIDDKVSAFITKKGTNYKAPGFRPGKVPFDHLKQVFYTEALQEALSETIQETSQEVLKTHNLNPALRPRFHVEPFKKDQGLEYKMTFEILPEIPEVSWPDLCVTQYKVSIPDEHVEEELKQFAQSQKTSKPLDAPRAAQKGDVLIVDMEMHLKSEKEPAKLETIKFELGTSYLNPEIEDALVGLNEGDVFEKEMTVPPEVKDRKLVGKPFLFKLIVKEIRESIPFDLNEEFAASLDFENLDALRQDFRENLQGKGDELAFLLLKRQILDYLAKKYTFDVPEQMVDLEFQTIWEQTLSEMSLSNASNENESPDARDKKFQEHTGKSEAALKEDFQKIATRRVRLGIVLSAIGAQNQIQLSQEEVSQAIYEKAKEYPGKERELIDYYRANSDAVLALQAPLFENKVIRYLIAQSKVIDENMSLKELEDYFEKNMNIEDLE